MYKKFNDTPFISENGNKKSIELFDTIEINNFAECIADFAANCETPMTIGLQGDWGSGKTSLMNMIKCHLAEGDFYKVDINTWHYSMFRQDEYLGIVIIKSLLEELSKLFENKNTKTNNSLGKLAITLGNGLQKALNVGKAVQIGGITYNDAMEAIKGEDTSLQVENLAGILLQFKQEFQALIRESLNIENERIFFFI